MKNLLLACLLGASLSSCSLLQRHEGTADEESEARNADVVEEGPLFDANGKEMGSHQGGGGNEPEVSRLNTKIAALETKLDVLTASMERMQAQKSQPVIEAEAQPQASLAAPVEEEREVQEAIPPAQVSAAPVRPAHPTAAPAAFHDGAASGAEKEFRAGMQLFQNNQYLEAASRFALMAKKFPNHLLAAHALYWAGEANGRGREWPMAVENWTELEKRYPRSAYVPEALAGLAKAYESLGDSTKGKYYRNLVLRSFPKSPVALHAEPSESVRVSTRSADIHRSSRPAAEETPAEEAAPVFDGGGDENAADTHE